MSITGQIVLQPAEEFPITEDFTDDLLDEDRIIGATVTSRNYATGLDTTATFLSPGPPAQIDDDAVMVTTEKRAAGGAHGETHIVTFTVTTELGSTYQHEVEVLVSES